MNEQIIIGLSVGFIFVLIMVIAIILFTYKKNVKKESSNTLEESLKALKEQMFYLRDDLDKKNQLIIESKEKTNNVQNSIEKIEKNITNKLDDINKMTSLVEKVSKDSVGLNEILQNRQARGAISEVFLENLIKTNLATGQFDFQKTLSNGNRVDCVLYLNKEKNKMLSIDSKFPLDTYIRYTENNSGIVEFRRDIKKHIDDIADKYIITDETEEWAMMFVPSEIIFSFIHNDEKCKEILSYSFDKRVIIVSPNTTLATLVSVNGILKNEYIKNEAPKIKELIIELEKEFERFNDRLSKVSTYKTKLDDEIKNLNITSEKIMKKVEKIKSMEI